MRSQMLGRRGIGHRRSSATRSAASSGRRSRWRSSSMASWRMATYFCRELPWWALARIGAWMIAWQMNLQHEIIHGHPTRKRAVNEAIGCGRCRSGSLTRSTARPISRHHADANLTDPFEDPESYYWAAARWASARTDLAPLVAAQSTLLGRMILGPAWMIWRFLPTWFVTFGANKGKTRSICRRHLLECAVVLVWVIGVCGMPFWVYVAVLRLSRRESRHGALLRRASRRAGGRASEQRSSRTPASSARCSSSTTCMSAHHLRRGCHGTRSRHSIG